MSGLAGGEEESDRLVMPSAREPLSLPADGYDANKLLEQKGQD